MSLSTDIRVSLSDFGLNPNGPDPFEQLLNQVALDREVDELADRLLKLNLNRQVAWNEHVPVSTDGRQIVATRPLKTESAHRVLNRTLH